MNISDNFLIRDAHPSEFTTIGQLLVRVYANLNGFPTPEEQPAYYKMLENVGDFTHQPGTALLVATSQNMLLGAVVYFNDIKHYASGGSATTEKNAAGFRLLAVAPEARGKGTGKALTEACIEKAKAQKRSQLIIHTTKAMEVAWSMYEKLGFKRSVDLDFMQKNLPVFGFRLILDKMQIK